MVQREGRERENASKPRFLACKQSVPATLLGDHKTERWIYKIKIRVILAQTPDGTKDPLMLLDNAIARRNAGNVCKSWICQNGSRKWWWKGTLPHIVIIIISFVWTGTVHNKMLTLYITRRDVWHWVFSKLLFSTCGPWAGIWNIQWIKSSY